MNIYAKKATIFILLLPSFLIFNSDAASQVNAEKIQKTSNDAVNENRDIRNISPEKNRSLKIKNDLSGKKRKEINGEVNKQNRHEKITVSKNYHIIVINPGDDVTEASMKGWSRNFRKMSIYNWGRSKQLLLLDDRKPVRDNVASFIKEYGSRITLKGLMRGRTYTAWIDFVRFHYYNTGIFPSRLKIFLIKKNREPLLLKEIDYNEIVSSKSLYRISIPYTETIEEKIDLLFVEYAPYKGFWGFWDIIISDRPNLPSILSRNIK